MGLERRFEEVARAISCWAWWRAEGLRRRERRTAPRALPVVSAPAIMRKVTWARFWRGDNGWLLSSAPKALFFSKSSMRAFFTF